MIFHKCVKKTNHNYRLCGMKIKRLRRIIWKKYHEKNWKENIMRWNKKRNMNNPRFKWAQQNFQKPNFKPFQFYKKEWNQKYKGLKINEIDAAKKKRMMMFKRLMQKARAKANLLRGFVVYQKQRGVWERSNAGKCLTMRKKDFVLNLSPMWGVVNEERQKKHEEFKKDMAAACEGVNKALPFSNGGCMEQLTDHYAQFINSFKEFLHNKSEENIKKLKEGHFKALHILKTQCIGGLMSIEKKSPACKKYIVNEFGFNNNQQMEDQQEVVEKPWKAAIKIVHKVNKFKKIVQKLTDEDFWLNAPEDCGVSKDVDTSKLVTEIKQLAKNKQP